MNIELSSSQRLALKCAHRSSGSSDIVVRYHHKSPVFTCSVKSSDISKLLFAGKEKQSSYMSVY